MDLQGKSRGMLRNRNGEAFHGNVVPLVIDSGNWLLWKDFERL